jgi:hypothetical protein
MHQASTQLLNYGVIVIDGLEMGFIDSSLGFSVHNPPQRRMCLLRQCSTPTPMAQDHDIWPLFFVAK